MQFVVKWIIDIEASSPQEAARMALDIQRDHDSTAVYFDVYDEDKRRYKVDLLGDKDET